MIGPAYKFRPFAHLVRWFRKPSAFEEALTALNHHIDQEFLAELERQYEEEVMALGRS